MMSKKEYMYWQNRKYRVSEVHLCASERSERAIFGVFNSFTVKKVSFFTINVKSYLQKVGGCLYRPSPHPKKWGGGGGGGIHPPSPPPPPGIYASGLKLKKFWKLWSPERQNPPKNVKWWYPERIFLEICENDSPERKFRPENGGLSRGTFPICIHNGSTPPPPGGGGGQPPEPDVYINGVLAAGRNRRESRDYFDLLFFVTF